MCSFILGDEQQKILQPHYAFFFFPLQDQPLGNWRLKRQVDDSDEIVYKFSPKFVLKAGQTVTVSNKE